MSYACAGVFTGEEGRGGVLAIVLWIVLLAVVPRVMGCEYCGVGFY